jgi:regulator of protease activity HflC (stomatin/prohibitin superfamily)
MGATFIEVVLHNLLALLPFVVIYSYQGGVRWTLGKNPVNLSPGFHWKIWFIQRIEIISVVDDFMELPIQSIITKDAKLVCFSVNIGYRITDVVRHFCEVDDFHSATVGISMTHLAQRVRELTLDELIGDLRKLETSLNGTLTTRMKNWGTEIFSVGFTNFAEVPSQFRVFGIGDRQGADLTSRA